MGLPLPLSPAVAARLAAAQAGQDEARHLAIGRLEVGDFGVLEATVSQVHPPRTFQRKRGGEGMVGRVTLEDATGSIDLVLWDDELRLTRDGPLGPAARITLRGAGVKAGWKGGLELGLGHAVIEAAAPQDTQTLSGTLQDVTPTEVVQTLAGPSFKAEATLATAEGDAFVTAWGDAVHALQVPAGSPVTLQAVPHPALDGCWIAGDPGQQAS